MRKIKASTAFPARNSCPTLNVVQFQIPGSDGIAHFEPLASAGHAYKNAVSNKFASNGAGRTAIEFVGLKS